MDLTHVTVTVQHRFAAAPDRVFALLTDLEETVVTQTFTHGPGVTYLSLSCDKRPDKAPAYISQRTDTLRANMLQVLASADALLGA